MGSRVIVGIEALTARGAKGIASGFDGSAALHSDAKKNASVARNMFGSTELDFGCSNEIMLSTVEG